jgi:hypothetical protein
MRGILSRGWRKGPSREDISFKQALSERFCKKLLPTVWHPAGWVSQAYVVSRDALVALTVVVARDGRRTRTFAAISAWFYSSKPILATIFSARLPRHMILKKLVDSDSLRLAFVSISSPRGWY